MAEGNSSLPNMGSEVTENIRVLPFRFDILVNNNRSLVNQQIDSNLLQNHLNIIIRKASEGLVLIQNKINPVATSSVIQEELNKSSQFSVEELENLSRILNDIISAGNESKNVAIILQKIIEDRDQQIAALTLEIRKLESEIQTIQGNFVGMEKEVQILRNDVEKLKEENERINSELLKIKEEKEGSDQEKALQAIRQWLNGIQLNIYKFFVDDKRQFPCNYQVCLIREIIGENEVETQQLEEFLKKTGFTSNIAKIISDLKKDYELNSPAHPNVAVEISNIQDFEILLDEAGIVSQNDRKKFVKLANIYFAVMKEINDNGKNYTLKIPQQQAPHNASTATKKNRKH